MTSTAPWTETSAMLGFGTSYMVCRMTGSVSTTAERALFVTGGKPKRSTSVVCAVQVHYRLPFEATPTQKWLGKTVGLATTLMPLAGVPSFGRHSGWT